MAHTMPPSKVGTDGSKASNFVLGLIGIAVAVIVLIVIVVHSVNSGASKCEKVDVGGGLSSTICFDEHGDPVNSGSSDSVTN